MVKSKKSTKSLHPIVQPRFFEAFDSHIILIKIQSPLSLAIPVLTALSHTAKSNNTLVFTSLAIAPNATVPTAMGCGTGEGRFYSSFWNNNL